MQCGKKRRELDQQCHFYGNYRMNHSVNQANETEAKPISIEQKNLRKVIKKHKTSAKKRRKKTIDYLMNWFFLWFVSILELNTHRLIRKIGDNQKAYNTHKQPKNFLFTCHYTPVYIIISLYVGLKMLTH